MKWNKWIRVTHRWLSIAFTAGVIINFIAVLKGKYTNAIGLMAGIPLVLSFITGLYLFALPYVAKWRTYRLNAQLE